eukprot:gene19960-25546_t
MAAWDGRPECNCVRQVLPRKFRVRDCTQGADTLQEAVYRALTLRGQAFYRAVADDFSAVDGIIKKQLTSRVPLVSKI